MPFRRKHHFRGGHAPNSIRLAFEEYVETHGGAPGPWPWHRLRGILWHCTDIMPSDLCEILDVPLGSTYAKGVRSMSWGERPQEIRGGGNVTHWTDVFGNDVTAADVVNRAAEDGLSVADWLAQQYAELGRENPDGGWDPESAPDFEALAEQIEAEAGEGA